MTVHAVIWNWSDDTQLCSGCQLKSETLPALVPVVIMPNAWVHFSTLVMWHYTVMTDQQAKNNKICKSGDIMNRWVVVVHKQVCHRRQLTVMEEAGIHGKLEYTAIFCGVFTAGVTVHQNVLCVKKKKSQLYFHWSYGLELWFHFERHSTSRSGSNHICKNLNNNFVFHRILP